MAQLLLIRARFLDSAETKSAHFAPHRNFLEMLDERMFICIGEFLMKSLEADAKSNVDKALEVVKHLSDTSDKEKDDQEAKTFDPTSATQKLQFKSFLQGQSISQMSKAKQQSKAFFQLGIWLATVSGAYFLARTDAAVADDEEASPARKGKESAAKVTTQNNPKPKQYSGPPRNNSSASSATSSYQTATSGTARSSMETAASASRGSHDGALEGSAKKFDSDPKLAFSEAELPDHSPSRFVSRIQTSLAPSWKKRILGAYLLPVAKEDLDHLDQGIDAKTMRKLTKIRADNISTYRARASNCGSGLASQASPCHDLPSSGFARATVGDLGDPTSPDPKKPLSQEEIEYQQNPQGVRRKSVDNAMKVFESPDRIKESPSKQNDGPAQSEDEVKTVGISKEENPQECTPAKKVHSSEESPFHTGEEDSSKNVSESENKVTNEKSESEEEEPIVLRDIINTFCLEIPEEMEQIVAQKLGKAAPKKAEGEGT